MKHLKLFLTALLFAVSMNSLAVDVFIGTSGRFKYKFIVSGGDSYHAILLGPASSGSILSGDVTIPETAGYRGGYTVVGIADSAFINQSEITTVTIPKYVYKIGHRAFQGCSKLTSINFEDINKILSIGSYCFNLCTSLTNAYFPKRVYGIEEGTYGCCRSLTKVKIPNTITTIGPRAFSECTGLTEVNISATNIGKAAFNKCTGLTEVNLSDSVKTIETYAFYGCTSLTEVNLSDSVKTIENFTFNGCTGLTSLNLKNVTTIGAYAFCGCSSLTSIIGDSVSTIKEFAFKGCTSATELYLPKSLKTLGDRAFANCSNLCTITADFEEVFGLPYYTFDSDIYNSAILYVPDSLVSTFQSTRCWNNFVNINNRRIVDSIVYDVQSADEVIPRTGQFTDYSGDIVIPSTIQSKCGDVLTIKRIEDKTFYLCPEITSITLPSTVNYIGSYAFAALDCDNYKERTTSKLKSVNIPEGVTTINEGTFSGCTELENITLPEGITSIEDDAFYGCSALTSVKLPSTVTRIGENAFAGVWEHILWYDGNNSTLKTIELPEGLKTIDTGAFEFCYELDNITLPSTLTYLGDYAFDACSKLKSIAIPKGVTTINEKTFAVCTELEDVTLPEGLTSIEYGAFSECTNLSSIDLPSTVKSIGDEAFYSTGLTSITIPTNTTTIGYGAFCGCEQLQNVTFNKKVTTIDSDAFWGTTNLKQAIELPNSVKEIGSYCFRFSGITSIKFSTNMTSIPHDVCSYCKNLETIIIPSNITSIDVRAFRGCTGLKSVYSYITDPFEIDNSVFDGADINKEEGNDTIYNNATLYVPKGTKTKYENTSSWKKFFKIVEMDGTTDITSVDANKDDDEVVGIYNINGTRVNELQRGVNIIKTKDGKTKKVIKK